MPDDAEVIVAGAGPAGATLAFFLARAGLDVLVVDRAAFPRDKPCSEYLSPQASRILGEMGALELIEAGSCARLHGMKVTAPDGTSFSGTFSRVRGFQGWTDYGLAVRRTILDATLLERARAAGARVMERVTVRDLERDGTGRVTGVQVTSGERSSVLRGRLVIGADGLRSIVARRARLGSHGLWPSRVALVAHWRGVDHADAVGDMHVFGDGYAGFAPVGGGLTNVALVVPSSRAPGMRGNAEEFMRGALVAQARTAERLRGAERATPVRAVGTFNWRTRQAWAPGLALVGDAADFFDPFTGEGIYAAMRGAELLSSYAFEAARAESPRRSDVALSAWDRCFRAEFAGKRRLERLIALAVASPFAMNLAARGLAARPGLADTLVGVTGDFVPARHVLNVRYLAQLWAAIISARRSSR